MESNNINEEKPKKSFEWGYLYKVYIVVLIAVFILACANMADAGVIFNNDYYEDPYLEMTDILDNETNYTAFKNGVEHTWGVTLPSWSDTTAIDDFTENVLMYFVGNYANLSATVVGQVSDAISNVTDILDLISFNLETGDFVATPNREGDLTNAIHGAVDPLIYTTPSTEPGELVVGNWFAMPVHWVSATLSGWTRDYVDGTGYVVYMCRVGGDGIIVASFQQGAYASWTGAGGYGNLTCDYIYQGSVSLGYYRSDYGYMYNSSSLNGSYSYYSSESDALADLFGLSEDDLGGDPYLNGEGYIINDNPTYPPLGIYPSATLDIPQLIVDGHTDTTDPEDPVGLPKGMNTVEPNPTWTDIPTWLVDPSMEFPEEPDYLGELEVEQPEFESDPTFIQTVYESLPSGIVLMISVSLGLGIAIKIIS